MFAKGDKVSILIHYEKWHEWATDAPPPLLKDGQAIEIVEHLGNGRYECLSEGQTVYIQDEWIIPTDWLSQAANTSQPDDTL